MIRTRVGYAGGAKRDPTYRDLGDHTETVEVAYDPSRITYDDLLEVFWNSHDPTRRNWSRQYASILFVQTDEQKRSAERSRARREKERGVTIRTEILPYTGFTPAENYHQKYSLKMFPDFLEELERVYPVPADFVNSTAAAQVNGYLGGFGSVANLQSQKDRLGLSPERFEELLRIVQERNRGQSCPVPRAFP